MRLKCKTLGCSNSYDAGFFVGDFCEPCWDKKHVKEVCWKCHGYGELEWEVNFDFPKLSNPDWSDFLKYANYNPRKTTEMRVCSVCDGTGKITKKI